jgi:hypothetical protein
MSLTIKVSKKIKNQCDTSRIIKSQVEIMDETKKSVICEISHCPSSRENSFCKNDRVVAKQSKEGNVSCFWDRHKIVGMIVKCPLRYKPKQIVKVYKSEISKEEYTIKENVVKFQNQQNFSMIPDNLEVTDAFCSFNCCLAWIRDNKHNRRYDQSEMLLHKIYKTIMTENSVNEEDFIRLTPAPDWRTLVEYGGSLSIDEFRKNTIKTKFTYNGTILDTGYLYSKRINIC